MKHLQKKAGMGAVGAVVLVATAWAGIGFAPVASTTVTNQVEVGRGRTGGQVVVADGELPGPGEALVGAAKISLKPRPEEFGGVWERDRFKCLPAGVSAANDPQSTMAHVADWRNPWIENSNCLYMGGYGLGPTNPMTSWDEEFGLWIRTTVVTDAQGDSVVLTLLDAEGYFGNYNKMCGPVDPRCGAFAIAEDLGAELGFSPSGFILASTHAHTALDLIGGWGGVPGWYMDQVTASIKDAVREAFDNRVPARIEAGETMLRGYNGERRSTYRSAEDPSMNWIRAYNRANEPVAFVGTYATHPVSASAGSGKAHADFPAVFSKSLETRQGIEVATLFQAGLGNMTGGGGWLSKGEGIAASVPALGSGTLVANPDVKVAQEFWNHPVTNGPIGTLGGGGFFDKPFGGPATVTAGKSSVKPCRSASAVSARVAVSAAKIGPVVITAAPGEIFANYTNTIEERSSVTALAIGQANDALGYMPQSFESDLTARQGAGFVGANFFEYEDAYAIDTCFGDMALETTLKLIASL